MALLPMPSLAKTLDLGMIVVIMGTGLLIVMLVGFGSGVCL